MQALHYEPDIEDSKPVGPFSADLYRNFGIGFAIGAMLVAGQASSVHWGSIASSVASAVAVILPL